MTYVPKGQLLSKANCQAVDSPKKQSDSFVLFFIVKGSYIAKSNGRIYGGAGAPIYFRFNLTFRYVHIQFWLKSRK